MIDVELRRIARLAEILNRGGYRSHGVLIPPALYLEHYRPAPLAAGLQFVLEEIDDQFTIRAFQEIIGASSASDLLSIQLGALRTGGLLNEETGDGAAAMFCSYAQRIVSDCAQFQERFTAVLDAYKS